MIHCIISVETVTGRSVDIHQIIIDFAISFGTLYLGMRHFINTVALVASNV